VNCFFIRNEALGLVSAAQLVDTRFAPAALHRPPNFFGEGRRHAGEDGGHGDKDYQHRQWVWV
jgi:hypothetical protein